MTTVKRIRDWWLKQYGGGGRLRKILLIGVPLLFACYILSMCSTLIAPPDAEPTAELADRSATIELSAPTGGPATEEPTAEPSATRPPPTDTPEPPTAAPTATLIPPTATPIPQPTAPSFAANLEIIAVNKQAEYVDIRNATGTDVMMTGWILRSEKGSHDCALNGVGLFPTGYTLRVWAMTKPPAQGEFSCGFDTEIWNNSQSDPAVLIDPSGQEVSRR